MLSTEAVLTVLAGHLSAAGLAQYDAEGRYLNSEVPAILWADADVPDNCLVLTIVDQDVALGHWDVEFGWRTTGVTPRSVEGLADSVADHFSKTFGLGSEGVAWQGGTAIGLPSYRVPGLLEWLNSERLSRGKTERTSDAKHYGQRFVRRDVWRLVMLSDETALPLALPFELTE